MKGDFTRNTFNPKKHFLRVLMQQGRVQVDADQREENSILLHYLQSLARDIIGPHGGPLANCGFEIFPLCNEKTVGWNFGIGSGHYYIDGILCEMDSPSTAKIAKVTQKGTELTWKRLKPQESTDSKEVIEEVITYYDQSDYPVDPGNEAQKQKDDRFPWLVYLDVWERHITYIEDNNIREIALGGPDTATRSKIVWQVKTCYLDDIAKNYKKAEKIPPSLLVEKFQPKQRRGRLLAQVEHKNNNDKEPCIMHPEARYRGAENQLYRVEIHSGGKNEATFKWSRENGSVVFPIKKISGDDVILENLGRNNRLSLSRGDFVEMEDDDYVLQNRAEELREVVDIDRNEMRVTLSPGASGFGRERAKYLLLRRWDHRAGDPEIGGLEIIGGAAKIKENEWLNVEDRIQVMFEALGGEQHNYRTGDFWLIPARSATGKLEWPEGKAVTPHGIEHHYAPLAIIRKNKAGSLIRELDCRNKFEITTS